MKQSFWSVRSDQQPLAIIAADRPELARTIVEALIDHGDLPQSAASAELDPCPARQARRTLSKARALGLRSGFLAYVAGGIFFTAIGGLTLPSVSVSAS
ncbi:hypothetical protein [Magnetospirillum aberrantis]|uniref:Uncharacterized protein n=1 Tax=Magnetospirillum aberrantis SpK TaxID=908842 RepID=A0A7C9QT38_9PROT|nr:hypothetical protein [Magnetospirillum aberrantis]NFV79421.1 hypothetical protein [Magnetospirillum aberrantis SpK]